MTKTDLTDSIRYDSSTGKFEYRESGTWRNMTCPVCGEVVENVQKHFEEMDDDGHAVCQVMEGFDE